MNVINLTWCYPSNIRMMPSASHKEDWILTPWIEYLVHEHE